MNQLSTRLLRQGKALTVFALVVDGQCEVVEFIDGLQEPDRRKAFALLKCSADLGVPYNEQKFKDIEGVANLFEFKPTNKVRLLCFRESRDYIVVLGVIKKRSRLRSQDIEKAQRLRDQFLDSTKGGQPK